MATATTERLTLDYPKRADGSYGPNAAQLRGHIGADLCDELLYGGAAGGGKTAWLIAEALHVCFRFPGSNVMLLRRRFDQLVELGGIAWTLQMRIPASVGTYNVSTRTWRFKNGSLLRLNYVARDADVTKFQGGEYAMIGWDQVEQFTEYQYTYLLHRLRVAGEQAAVMEAAGYRPKSVATANPGGVGHGWVKRRWIDPHPLGSVVFRPPASEHDENPGARCFIPAKIYDNLSNLHPSYIQRLKALPEDLRRAMLDGDWDVYAGQMFKGFKKSVHVVPVGMYPMNMLLPQRRAVGVDYGMSAPFCALWGAKLPDGLIVIYRELYKPELTPEQQARLILDSELPNERTALRRAPVALDPSTWARNPNSPWEDPDPQTGAPPPSSIAGTYAKNKVPVRKANNNRLAGVARIHEKLQTRGDGRPRIHIVETCTNLIRTLPELVHDEKDPEDVDTHGEDHAFDALKYLLFELEPATNETPAAPHVIDSRTTDQWHGKLALKRTPAYREPAHSTQGLVKRQF